MLFYRKLVNPCSLLPPQADLQGRGKKPEKGTNGSRRRGRGRGVRLRSTVRPHLRLTRSDKEMGKRGEERNASMGGGWRKGGRGGGALGQEEWRVSGGARRGSHCPSFFIRCSPLFAPRMRKVVFGGNEGRGRDSRSRKARSDRAR